MGMVYGSAIGWIASVPDDAKTTPVVLMIILGGFAVFIVFFFYNTFFVGIWGTTIGKRMVGIKVVNEFAQPPGFGRAFGRAWGEVFSLLLLGLGYVAALFDRQKRALHDHLCGTRVVMILR